MQLLSVTKSNINLQQIEGIFWRCAVWLLQAYFACSFFYDLLLKEHLPRTEEGLEQDCLEFHCERSLKYSSKFAFIHRRSRDSERPGLRYALLFELTKYIDTESGAISNPFENFKNFKKC